MRRNRLGINTFFGLSYFVFSFFGSLIPDQPRNQAPLYTISSNRFEFSLGGNSIITTEGGSIFNYAWRTQYLADANEYTETKTGIVSEDKSLLTRTLSSETAFCPAPSITRAQQDVICVGEKFRIAPVNTIDGVVPAGTTYTWTIKTDNADISGQGPQAVPQTAIEQTLTHSTNETERIEYEVTPTSGSCVGQKFVVVVLVRPYPVVANQTITVCSGAQIIYEAPHGLNSNIVSSVTDYTWSVQAGYVNNNITGQNLQGSYQPTFTESLTNLTNTQQTIKYTLVPRSENTCTGQPFTLTIVVNPSPKIAAKTTSTCSGETFSVTPTNTGSDIVPANTTYTWTVASNPDVEGESNQDTGQTSISQTLTNTSNTVKTVVYTVRPTYVTGNCAGSTFQLSVQVNPKPVIQASTETICKDGPLPVLSTIYGGTGTPTYQWYSNGTNSNTGGAAITTNGTAASYTPPTSAIGITYYYVELAFSSGLCTLVKSSPVKIEVVAQPTVSTQPEALRSICVGGSVSAYSVAYTGGTGNATYQWYSNTTNSNTNPRRPAAAD